MMKAALEKFRQSIQGKIREELIEIALTLFLEKEDLKTELGELREVQSGIVREYEKVRKDNEKYEAEINALRKQNQQLTYVKTLRTNELFGRSCEKTEDILNKSLASGNPVEEDPVDEDAEDGMAGSSETGNVDSMAEAEVRRLLKELLGEKEKKKKKKGKRELDLSKLPVRKTYVYDVQELNKEYGNGWRIIGWNRSREVERVRSCCYLQITYDPQIETMDGRVLSPFRKEPLIEKSLASPSLVASLLYDKYGMFLPYYRQEKDPDRFGLPISRQTMSNWELHVCEEFFIPVYEYIRILMRAFEYQHCDETPWMVVLDGRKPGAKGYMWVHLSGELLKGFRVAFMAFELTRAADHLTNFFNGIGHPVHLTDDAYSGYYTLQNRFPGIITVCGCLTHCRRRFVEAILVMRLERGTSADDLKDIPEYKCLLMIAGIYKVDEPLKALTADERLVVRQKDEKPLFDEFIGYVKSIDAASPDVSGPFKEAISYTLNHEQELRQFLNDGNIPIDNGDCERLIRNIARLRVNSLFSTTERGARSTAIILTLMLTAELNGADPYYYLKYLMDELPEHLYQDPSGYVADMMPWTNRYREYEKAERQRMVNCMAPPGGNEKLTAKMIHEIRNKWANAHTA